VQSSKLFPKYILTDAWMSFLSSRFLQSVEELRESFRLFAARMHSRETLNDHKGNVSIGRDTAANPFLGRGILDSWLAVQSSKLFPKYILTDAWMSFLSSRFLLPRAPEGASVMMAPASATYQQAVPIPLIAPLRMRYCSPREVSGSMDRVAESWTAGWWCNQVSFFRSIP
jgi:hypothetical protein